MGNCYLADHIAEEHIHIYITCNTEEPQQKYRLGTVSNRLMGGLNMFYWIQTSPSASAIVQPNQTITTITTTHCPYICITIFKILASIVPEKTLTQIFNADMQTWERKKNGEKMEE